MIRALLRRFPGLRLSFKLWLLDVGMIVFALQADDEKVPARKRMECGRRVMQFVRWHRWLSALRGSL